MIAEMTSSAEMTKPAEEQLRDNQLEFGVGCVQFGVSVRHRSQEESWTCRAGKRSGLGI